MNKYLNPRNYLSKGVLFWDQIYHGSRYNLEKMRSIEKNKFIALGFDYENAVTRLDSILEDLGKPGFASQKGMGSVHWVLFSALSLLGSKESIKDILEIGTYDGETAAILSRMFPQSNITTLDLPDDDPIFSQSYQRDDPDKKKQFKKRQNANLANPKISFIQANSFFLPGKIGKKFDLIWIDGGHLYPEIAWDICNAYHLCNSSGWILCDDVIPHPNGVSDDYSSPDSFNVLEYLASRSGEKVTYFLKRESSDWSANPRKRKYVSMIRKS